MAENTARTPKKRRSKITRNEAKQLIGKIKAIMLQNGLDLQDTKPNESSQPYFSFKETSSNRLVAAVGGDHIALPMVCLERELTNEHSKASKLKEIGRKLIKIDKDDLDLADVSLPTVQLFLNTVKPNREVPEREQSAMAKLSAPKKSKKRK